MKVSLSVGFIPLIDAAPLIVAHEMGFAAEEGIDLHLQRAPSWSALRDKLSFGHLDAAHMLSPVPVATALGLGGGGVGLAALSVLSVNGNVVGVSRDLADRLRDAGHDFAFNDASSAGHALIDLGQELRIGVPFPFSMHAELVYYWLSALGLPAPQAIKIRTVPPPLMVDAVQAGEIDVFCVGEPWGSKVVETGVGALLLPCSAIWAFAPEKVLAVRADWAESETVLGAKLVRSVWRAGRWLSDAGNQSLVAELLSRPNYLDLSPDTIECGLSGQFLIDQNGTMRHAKQFIEFHQGAAGFPWRSQAAWIGHQLALRTGLDRAGAVRQASAVFRSDLYRQALLETHADLPSASSKIEGTLPEDIQAGSSQGNMILKRNAFFDGSVFDPDEI